VPGAAMLAQDMHVERAEFSLGFQPVCFAFSTL